MLHRTKPNDSHYVNALKGDKHYFVQRLDSAGKTSGPVEELTHDEFEAKYEVAQRMPTNKKPPVAK